MMVVKKNILVNICYPFAVKELTLIKLKSNFLKPQYNRHKYSCYYYPKYCKVADNINHRTLKSKCQIDIKDNVKDLIHL